MPGVAGRLSGNGSWAWLYLGCSAAALVAYVLGLAAVRRRGLRLGAVAALAVGIQLAPLAAPLLLSSDAWTYWDYGRIAAVHGGNPYRDTPADFPGDPAFAWVGADWRETTSVYGPAFTLASEPIALAAGASAEAAAWIYKALAASAALAAAALAARLARRKSFAFAFAGWNPLLALHFAGGGHNDAWMAALVLAALALAASGRTQWAGAAWLAAVLVKWVPLIFLALRAVEARATRRPVAHGGFAIAAALVIGVATWQFGWHWLGAFGPLARNANQESEFALPHRLATLGVPGSLALALLLAAFALAYLWLLREARRGRARLALAAGLL
ncbi:MAG: glycosyltransferase 87 family protein, partial [Actinomycetota bacterium]|nr:glycosyltransferase 87 family protein [Actinomycetota bacterium]